MSQRRHHINYSPGNFDVLIFIYVCFKSLKIVYPGDITSSYQEVIFRVPISKRSLTEHIKIFDYDFVYSSSEDRSGLYQMVLKLANFMALKRYDLSVPF